MTQLLSKFSKENSDQCDACNLCHPNYRRISKGWEHTAHGGTLALHTCAWDLVLSTSEKQIAQESPSLSRLPNVA